MLRWLA